LGDDQRAGAFLAHAFEQQGEDFVGGARVEVAGRFVGQDQRRPVYQRAGDRHALQFATRQRARPARAEAGQPDAGQQGFDADGMLPGFDAAEQQRHGDVLRHGERGQDMEGLEDEADGRGAQRGARGFVEAHDVALPRDRSGWRRHRPLPARRCS
jgi:hypothetical protein